MIHKIEIKNFKSHRHTVLDLKNLTVLCGANNVGKSTIIQTLLLLRDNYIKFNSFINLELNTDSVKMGTFDEVCYEFMQEIDNVEIFLDIDGTKIELSFGNNKREIIIFANKKPNKKTSNYNYSTMNYYNLRYLIKGQPTKKQYLQYLQKLATNVQNKNLFTNRFQYIGAERLSPFDRNIKNEFLVEDKRQISYKFGRCEFVLHFLELNKNLIVIDELCIDNNFKQLINQVVLWYQKINADIADMQIKDYGNGDLELHFKFNATNYPLGTKFYKSYSVGYGFTYLLPIIVAILSAQKNDLIIIENPETHLNPAAISVLAELICLASQAGIQIILETHSDHIINGILVQSKNFEEKNKGIYRENVAVFNFTMDKEDLSTNVEQMTIEAEGKFDKKYPKGFFDQIKNDLENLMGF